jgi:uncharacterized protein YggE
MNRKFFVTTAGVFLMLLGHQANAQDTDADEPTMRLMGNAEATLPEAVTKTIMLPVELAENSAAVDNAANGFSVANENRLRREAGLTTADEARNRAEEMSEAAQENRETHGRSDDLPDPPQRPEPPQRPDTPQPQGGN